VLNKRMSQEKIAVQNINAPDHIVNVRADKYTDMRAALMRVLPSNAPGLTFTEIKDAVKPLLDQALFPEGATCGWWAKCVQLDLEAKGVLQRNDTSPLRFYKS